jgi:riboflavin kinase/FMN adenylyltransferase
VQGTVINGDHRGRHLGAATANVQYTDTAIESLLKFGVYAVEVSVDAGKAYLGVANFGVKPTFNGKASSLEVHLFDFDGNLYGRNVSVVFRKYVRPEICFKNENNLKKQIQEDIQSIREYFSNEPEHLLTED